MTKEHQPDDADRFCEQDCPDSNCRLKTIKDCLMFNEGRLVDRVRYLESELRRQRVFLSLHYGSWENIFNVLHHLNHLINANAGDIGHFWDAMLDLHKQFYGTG